MPEVAQARRRGRLVHGVVPSGALVALVAGVLLLVWPWGREQVQASFVRQPASYVALSFSDPGAARSCPAVDGRLRLTAVVDNRGPSGLTSTAAVSITPSGRSPRVERVPVRVGSEEDVRLPIDVRVPRTRSYVLDVSLSGRSERLRVTCEGPT